MQFTVKTTIKARAQDIYTAWLSSEGHTSMTGGKAVISDKRRDRFTAWDGYIEGKNLDLEPYRMIVQSWRTTQFKPDEKDSKIKVLLNEYDGITEITLIHSDVPESGSHYIEGWDTHYFQPMKAYFTKVDSI